MALYGREVAAVVVGQLDEPNRSRLRIARSELGIERSGLEPGSFDVIVGKWILHHVDIREGAEAEERVLDRLNEERVRSRAFQWLAGQVSQHGDVLPWALLLEGFEWEGRRVPLVSQQGIFKPAVLDVPLSIRTSPAGPYADAFRRD